MSEARDGACAVCGGGIEQDDGPFDPCPTLCYGCFGDFLAAEFLMSVGDLLSPDLTFRQALARSEARMRRVGMSERAIRAWWSELEPLLLAAEAKHGVYAGGLN